MPRALAALVAAAWSLGLVLFVTADGEVTLTLPRRAPPPAGEHNLAAWAQGPTVRASSYHRHPSHQHHPMWVVGGRAQPTMLEKWASARDDRAPFIEVWWREPRTLARVVVTHAGQHEDARYNLTSYELTCLGGAGPQPRLRVADNTAKVAVHAMPCAGARGVRLDAHVGPGDIARIFALEAFGQ